MFPCPERRRRVRWAIQSCGIPGCLTLTKCDRSYDWSQFLDFQVNSQPRADANFVHKCDCSSRSRRTLGNAASLVYQPKSRESVYRKRRDTWQSGRTSYQLADCGRPREHSRPRRNVGQSVGTFLRTQAGSHKNLAIGPNKWLCLQREFTRNNAADSWHCRARVNIPAKCLCSSSGIPRKPKRI